jgi:hypothetical protein
MTSCFEIIPSRSDANADLKQPLVVVQDLESPSSSHSEEEQMTESARREASNRILVKSLCFGAFSGLFLHIVTFSALFLFTLHFGKNSKPDESASVSYWTLYLIINADTAFYTLFFGGFLMTLTRKGSMYMRKKFDNDADNPNSQTIWTPRFLVLTGFLVGITGGSYAAWAIVVVKLGRPVPLAPLLCTLLVDVGRYCLMIKCFDSGRRPITADDDDLLDEDQAGDQEEDDSFFV